MKFAIVRGARSAKELWAYLPHNFVIVGGGGQLRDRGGRTEVRHEYVIAGLDMSGWTLDDYVIPRLGSGSIGAREITATQAVDWIHLYQIADQRKDGYYLLDASVDEQEPIAVHKPNRTATHEGRDELITEAFGIAPGETLRLDDEFSHGLGEVDAGEEG
jgi:hypothetical protein